MNADMLKNLKEASNAIDFQELGFVACDGQVILKHPELDTPDSLACRYWIFTNTNLGISIVLYDEGNGYYSYVGEYNSSTIGELLAKDAE